MDRLAGMLSVERIKIPIRDLPARLDGLTLVQLSDFHFDGVRLSVQLLEEAIAAANAAHPDAVLLTGDYVTEEPHPIYGLAQHLKSLKSNLGTYAILGNHDLCQPTSRRVVTHAMTEVGIRVLWDEIVYPFGEDLALVGLRDYWSPRFNPQPVLARVPERIPRIVLSHNPDSAKTLQQWRVDLQLSGHTHGGEVVLPGFGPAVVGLKQIRKHSHKSLHRWMKPLTKNCDKVVQNWDWAQGLHRVGENVLYVNRGLGTHLPGRLFCPPEVTVIVLQAWS
ncbi:metallophosphoesterase [Altericista sp. CCNU0014]|uniref:metallophosphoesterase n=1 Tax=Altericista sp. CCNU0014 TaxID=3082949 RepID=UPI00384C9643